MTISRMKAICSSAIAPKVTGASPVTVADTVFSPGPLPSVNDVEASPALSVWLEGGVTDPPPPATAHVTMSDVAQLAGVSLMTVSRALRGERAVDAQLVSKVQAAADKLGYLPDPAARALASSRSRHVAVLIPMLSNALFVDLLEAVQRTLLKVSSQLMKLTHIVKGSP